MTTKTIMKRDPSRKVTLPVTSSGMQVVIGAGEFRIGQEVFNLPEATTYSIQPAGVARAFLFYLMETHDNQPLVIVDEVKQGDLPMSMGNDPDHIYLWYLASLSVPASATNLDTAHLLIMHSDVPEKKVS